MRLSSMACASAAVMLFLALPAKALIEAGAMVSHPETRHHGNDDMSKFQTTRRRLFGTAWDGHVQQPILFKERREKQEEAYTDDITSHPIENEDEIDCSQFTNLDDVPSFCQENQTGQGDYPVAGETQEPTPGGQESGTALGAEANDAAGTSFVDSTIRLQLSLGIHELDEITERRSELLLWLVIQVASVLLDRYSPFDVFAPSNGEDFMYMESHQGEGDGYTQSIANAAAGTYEDNGDQLLASLFFAGVESWDSPKWNAWLQVSMDYVAFGPNGQPVVEPDRLEQIEAASWKVINMTVDALKFWNELQKQDESGQFILKDGCPWQQLDAPTIVAVAKIGEEYALESLGYGNTKISGDEREVPWEPLSTEWSMREWLGLGICVSTLAIAALLTLVSARIQRLEATQRVWGLTEQGVGELLNVGWTYHQERNGQLFLKIFDKGHIGYTDDNSVLRATTPIAEDATPSSTTASPES